MQWHLHCNEIILLSSRARCGRLQWSQGERKWCPWTSSRRRPPNTPARAAAVASFDMFILLHLSCCYHAQTNWDPGAAQKGEGCSSILICKSFEAAINNKNSWSTPWLLLVQLKQIPMKLTSFMIDNSIHFLPWSIFHQFTISRVCFRTWC